MRRPFRAIADTRTDGPERQVATSGGRAWASPRAPRRRGARAVTIGRDIYFARGEYAPGTPRGDDLLAHELTHVDQGLRGELHRAAAKGLESGGVLDASEAEADLRAKVAVVQLHDPESAPPALAAPPIAAAPGQVSTGNAYVDALQAPPSKQALEQWSAAGGKATTGAAADQAKFDAQLAPMPACAKRRCKRARSPIGIRSSMRCSVQRELSLPLGGGPSGTTNTMMTAARALGADATSARLACIGYLISARHHTLVEILAAAAAHGCGYTPGQRMYRDIAPLSDVELRGCGKDGKLPDEATEAKK